MRVLAVHNFVKFIPIVLFWVVFNHSRWREFSHWGRLITEEFHAVQKRWLGGNRVLPGFHTWVSFKAGLSDVHASMAFTAVLRSTSAYTFGNGAILVGLFEIGWERLMVEGMVSGFFFVKDRPWPDYFARYLGASVENLNALIRWRLVQQILAPIFEWHRRRYSRLKLAF